jgi:hypothetical protein
VISQRLRAEATEEQAPVDEPGVETPSVSVPT